MIGKISPTYGNRKVAFLALFNITYNTQFIWILCLKYKLCELWVEGQREFLKILVGWILIRQSRQHKNSGTELTNESELTNE